MLSCLYEERPGSRMLRVARRASRLRWHPGDFRRRKRTGSLTAQVMLYVDVPLACLLACLLSQTSVQSMHKSV